MARTGALRDAPEAVVEWLLLHGNRHAIAVGMLVVAFVILQWMQTTGVLDVDRDTVAMLYLFQTLAGANFTLVTIVISINQLVLSRELRTPRELQSEQEAATEYRSTVEEEVDRPVVPESAENFLVVLVRNTRTLLDRLDDEIAGVDDSTIRDDASGLQSTLVEELEEAMSLLEESHVGVFAALSTILDTNFASCINHSRWLRHAHGDELPSSLEDCLGELEDRLEQLDVARQYFKTIYVQQELADLSRVVLLTGLLAMGVAIALLASVGFLSNFEPAWERPLLVPLAVTINLAPMTILFTHVMRISTVARRTAAISPFIP